MSTTKTKNNSEENKNMEEVENSEVSRATDPQSNDKETQKLESLISEKAKIAGMLAQMVSPTIGSELKSGRISFAALTVIVDSRYSASFPFYPPSPAASATEKETESAMIDLAKIEVLAAIEFARSAAHYKRRSMRILDEGSIG